MRPQIVRVRTYVRRHGMRATIAETVRRVAHAARQAGYPSAIHVELSGCCNLRCEYCVLDEGAEGDRIMSLETFGQLAPALSRARRIDLSGLAEPLMNKRFALMLADVRRIAPHAYLTLCTNATLLSREIAEDLVKHRLDELVFSLDGVEPELVDRVRRGGSLEVVLGNIRALREVITSSGATRPVLSATTVLQRSNVDQLPSIVRLAHEVGCVAVNVNGLEPYTQALVDHAVWETPEAIDGLSQALLEAEQAARTLGVELRLPALAPQPPICPQIFRPIILADGTVVPCSTLAYRRRSYLEVDSNERAARREGSIARRVFGNTRNGGLLPVWKDRDYRSFRRRVRRGRFPDECRACLLKHGVICPATPLTAAESLASIRQER